MEACCKGEASEPREGRRGRKGAGVWGEVPVNRKLGVELKDRRG